VGHKRAHRNADSVTEKHGHTTHSGQWEYSVHCKMPNLSRNVKESGKLRTSDKHQDWITSRKSPVAHAHQAWTTSTGSEVILSTDGHTHTGDHNTCSAKRVQVRMQIVGV